MTAPSDRVRREVLILVGLVLVVDAAFIAGYYLAGVGRAKVGYTILWTAAILLVVLRSLARVRAERIRRRS
jgi:hypothetical protein